MDYVLLLHLFLHLYVTLLTNIEFILIAHQHHLPNAKLLTKIECILIAYQHQLQHQLLQHQQFIHQHHLPNAKLLTKIECILIAYQHQLQHQLLQHQQFIHQHHLHHLHLPYLVQIKKSQQFLVAVLKFSQFIQLYLLLAVMNLTQKMLKICNNYGNLKKVMLQLLQLILKHPN